MGINVNDCIKNIQSWLLPSCCVLCGVRAEGELCAGCERELPVNTSCCTRCAVPLPETKGELVCGPCTRQPPAYDRALSLLRYAYPADKLIQRLKFNAQLHLARLLGERLAGHITRHVTQPPQVIIPVPLHCSRLRERGFNQALELARPVARRLNIPLDYRSGARVRATAVQSLLPAAQRRRNIKGAFQITRPLAAHHAAIVDDVMTTGHTVEEFAATLRKAGVEKIDVWVLARAAPGL